MALSSMAFVLLSILYVIIDVYSLWLGAPFIYPGILLELLVHLFNERTLIILVPTHLILEPFPGIIRICGTYTLGPILGSKL